MMQILELLAFKYKMDWLMLTVFKENTSAMHFYIDKLKYVFNILLELAMSNPSN